MSTPPSGGSGAQQFVVLNDAPVGDVTGDDLLEAGKVAGDLAELVFASRSATPFALAIDAAWGMGKSSLMRRLEATLTAKPGVSGVWFNAWTSGDASALEGLIKSVLLRFDRNVIRRAVRAMSGRRQLLGALRVSALVVASFFGLGRVVDEIWRRLSVDAQSRNEIKGVLHEAFDAWLARGGADGRRLLVVFVDDLDRCGSDRIIEVCEAIKLYLDVPGIVFVLACDQSALWRAVRDAVGIDGAAGAVEYLEKIIQLNYRIPVPSPELAARLVDGLLARSNIAQHFDESMTSVIIERSGRNPRRIKRLINSFVLEYHLNRAWDDIGVQNLVKVILLQHFYPDFYRILADPRATDPMADFRAYAALRTALRTGDVDPMQWRVLFQGKGLKAPAVASEDNLAALERELPPEFPLLAADRDFVALIRSFEGSVGSQELRELLHHNPLSATPDYTAPPPAFEGEPRRPLWPTSKNRSAGELAGMRILWLDDRPETNRNLAGRLRDLGATVATATDLGSALAQIEQARPDVVLSDFTRQGNVNAGLDDLAHLRTSGIYDGPVIFCSGQGTPQRRARAEELGALGPSNDENTVLAWLTAIEATRRAIQ